MTARARDRRVDRSRRALHGALVELVLARGWDRVTVQEVCDRAGVGRSTFYAHFADKEELLIGGLDHVKDDLLRHPAAGPFGFVRGLLEHAASARRLVRAVIGRRSGLAVQRRFREIVRELVAADLASQRVPTAERDAVARYLAGGLVELIFGWIDGRPTMTIAELEATFVRLSTPVMRAVTGADEIRDTAQRLSRTARTRGGDDGARRRAPAR